MIDVDNIKSTVVKGLKQYLGCTITRNDQNSPMPAFPYCTYKITALASENKGSHGVFNDGKIRKPYILTMSFTAHSDDYSEAVTLACKAHEWFDYVGTVFMNDNDVIVQSVGSVSDRSNLLTSDYIYSQGFDVFFWLYEEITEEQWGEGEIKTATIGGAVYDKPDDIETLNRLLEKRLDGVD